MTRNLELTDDELQETLSTLREARNQCDDAVKVYGLKQRMLSHEASARDYYRNRSTKLTRVMKKIYRVLDND